jgi:adenylyl-sulfate kinase
VTRTTDHQHGGVGPPGFTVWLTGLPASGKTTLAATLAVSIGESPQPVSVLDGDAMRQGMNAGLGFSLEDRRIAVRRAGERAVALARAGHVVLVAMVSPIRKDRAAVRRLHDQEGIAFVEVWVSTPLAVCARRDPKRLYHRARHGELTQVTGVDSPYEQPTRPAVAVTTEYLSPVEAADRVLTALQSLVRRR